MASADDDAAIAKRKLYRSVFDSFDTDKSGTVSTSELRAMLVKLDMTTSEEELEKMMKDADPDGSGEIDFHEFIEAVGDKGGLSEVFKKASAFLAEADKAGATWIKDFNPLAAAGKLARAKNPVRRAFPGAPTNGSYALAAEMGTPEDATCYEIARDETLGFFIAANTFFMFLAGCCVAVIAVFGVIIGIMLFSAVLPAGAFDDYVNGCNDEANAKAEYMREHNLNYNPGSQEYNDLTYTPPAHNAVDMVNDEPIKGWCTYGQWWFNLSIKVFTIVFSYINLLPVPWRIAILMNTLPCGRQAAKDTGVDFYGRPTEALWFHLPREKRRWIAINLNIAWVAHYASLASHLVYWDYVETQIWPGILAANLPFIVSIITPIIAGCIQGKAEQEVIKKYPKRFPPSPQQYYSEAWKKYRAECKEHPEKKGTCFSGFIPFFKEAQEKMKADAAEFEAAGGLKSGSMSGIVVQKATSTRESERKEAPKGSSKSYKKEESNVSTASADATETSTPEVEIEIRNEAS